MGRIPPVSGFVCYTPTMAIVIAETDLVNIWHQWNVQRRKIAPVRLLFGLGQLMIPNPVSKAGEWGFQSSHAC